MDEPTPGKPSIKIDPLEVQLEAKDLYKYLLAQTFFNCREYDRCAAVFLPHTLPKIPISAPSASPQTSKSKPTPTKGKAKATVSSKLTSLTTSLKNVSKKSLFLSLYAKYLAGEKRKDEESEMILGPYDGGVTVNKELNGIAATLEEWFRQRKEQGGDGGGWLEYLYGIVLAKGKNEELAKQYLIESVHIYPYNWGAWQELGSLIGTVEEVRIAMEGMNHVLTRRSSTP